jgi:hypothetical protein
LHKKYVEIHRKSAETHRKSAETGTGIREQFVDLGFGRKSN